MDYIGLLGFAAGTVTVVSFIPQTLRVWRTRSTHDLSGWSYGLLVIGSTMWASYGVLKADWPIILPNVIVLILISTILVAKVRFK